MVPLLRSSDNITEAASFPAAGRMVAAVAAASAAKLLCSNAGEGRRTMPLTAAVGSGWNDPRDCSWERRLLVPSSWLCDVAGGRDPHSSKAACRAIAAPLGPPRNL